MKKNLRTKFAAVVIAASALVAAPVAAQAYTPDAPGNGTATLAAGGSATYTFSGFQPGASVTFTLTGEFVGDANLATIVLAAPSSTTETKTANASGQASVTVTLPANATGQYTLTAASGGASDVLTIAVAAAASGDGLPNTGGDPASLAGVWIGGGALLAAGAALTGVTLVRRRQSQGA